ncbi:Chaperonin Cpn60/TCP-1 family [Trinorchestia longiramus]|nr:Chaperonin Cpn60/TCP-1 family [Trinorchestia longiramus]
MRSLGTTEIVTGFSVISGANVRERTLRSIQAVSNAVKTSFGAFGLDKMCIDKTGDITITNDGATILHMMNVEDPIAAILVDLARQQDIEVGDGTTGVVLLASALIEEGIKLIEKGMHSSQIVAGYKMAYNACQSFITKKLLRKICNTDDLSPIVNTTLCSKVIHSEHFINLIQQAVRHIRCERYGRLCYPIEEIQILKKEGNSMEESFLFKGYVLNCIPAARSMVRKIEDAKIVLIDFDLRKMKMPLGAQIIAEDPDKLESMRQMETELVIKRVRKLLQSANVILSSKGIDDVCLKPIVDSGAIAVRRVKSEDLRNLSKILGVPVQTSLYDLDGQEEVRDVGRALSVSVETICDDECIFIKTESKTASIILRGANEELLMEMERNVHDALCVLKRTLESQTILPGGGAFECSLSYLLDEFAKSITSKEQLGVYAFANALLNIPKILAANAGLDPNELLGQLRKFHFSSGGNSSDAFEYGLNIIDDHLEYVTPYQFKNTDELIDILKSGMEIDELTDMDDDRLKIVYEAEKLGKLFVLKDSEGHEVAYPNRFAAKRISEEGIGILHSLAKPLYFGVEIDVDRGTQFFGGKAVAAAYGGVYVL